MDRSVPAAPSSGEADRWLRFVARWSLLFLAVISPLVALTFSGLGQTRADSLLGDQYGRLLYAVRLPTMNRLVQTLEAAGWLAWIGTLLALAGACWRHAPIRASFAAACVVASMLTGPVARFTHRDITADFAARYAAVLPHQQAAVLQEYGERTHHLFALFQLGHLYGGAAFLLVGWAAFSLVGFPRGLAAWLVLPGIGIMAMFVISVVGDVPTPAPLLLVNNILVLGGLHIALAVRLWRFGEPRRGARLVPALAGP